MPNCGLDVISGWGTNAEQTNIKKTHGACGQKRGISCGLLAGIFFNSEGGLESCLRVKKGIIPKRCGRKKQLIGAENGLLVATPPVAGKTFSGLKVTNIDKVHEVHAPKNRGVYCF